MQLMMDNRTPRRVLDTIRLFLEFESFTISKPCIIRVLGRKKCFMFSVAILTILTVTVIRILTPPSEFYNIDQLKYVPNEIIIRPGELAHEVSNITRSVPLNDFSKYTYIIGNVSTRSSSFKNSPMVAEKKAEVRNLSTLSATNPSKPEESTHCSPTLCNKGVCFENMLCYKLPPFDPRFKNPCFYEEVSEDDSDQNVYKNKIILRMVPDVNIPAVQNFHNSWQTRRNGTQIQLRCLPYFFIIGMEKCGTTDLYQRINMHPEVALSMAKELQWWTRRRFFYFKNGEYPKRQQSDEYKLQHISDLKNVPFKHYYAFFDNVADQISAKTDAYYNGTSYHKSITGDGSPNTMYWNDFRSIFQTTNGSERRRSLVAHHIAATLPRARIIAILRNPADRLYSSYLFFNRGATKTKFHNIVQTGIKLFEECKAKKALRDCVYDAQLKELVGSTVNIMQGIYSVMLEDWLEVFPMSQVHIVHFETYKQSELDTINKIFQFLDLPVVSKAEKDGKRIMSKEKAFGGKQYDLAGQMMSQTRTLLESFYQPFNKELARLLNDDRYLWLPQTE